MAREKIPSPGFDEPADSSVLSLVPENARTWFLDDDGEGAYCVGVAELAKEKVGVSIGPIFRRDMSEAEAHRYECRARWRVGSMKIALTSGWCTSTKEAFERICAQAQTLPMCSGDTLNWLSVLSNELGFPGTNIPHFENTTEIGTPTVVCTLDWGNSYKRFKVKSNPCPSRVQAFQDAVELARAKGPAPEPPPKPAPVIKPPQPVKLVNWEHAARRQVQGKGQIGDGQLKVSFLPGKSVNNVTCKIRWGLDLKFAVESFPMASQAEAFDQAVLIFKREVLVQLAKKSKSKPKVEAIKDSPGVKVTDPLDEQAKALLNLAKRHWGVERAWLMGHSLETKVRTQRLHDLNTFLVLLDPLRCYEIDRGARDVAIGRITVELQKINYCQSKSSQNIRHAAQLRALIGQRFADAGTAVTMTDAFAEHTKSSGIQPERAIEELVQVQLLRALANGELSISTLGANLLDRNFTTEIQSGKLGASLPQGVVVMLLNLKDSLSGNRP